MEERKRKGGRKEGRVNRDGREGQVPETGIEVIQTDEWVTEGEESQSGQGHAGWVEGINE